MLFIGRNGQSTNVTKPLYRSVSERARTQGRLETGPLSEQTLLSILNSVEETVYWPILTAVQYNRQFFIT